MELKKLVGNLLGELNKMSKSDAVVGGVRDAGKAKVVPLSKISIGFGTGLAGVDGKRSSSDAGGEAGGAGGAISVEPRAFVVVGEDGKPHMVALKGGKKAVLRRGIELSPSQLAEHADNPQLTGKPNKDD